MYFLAFAFLCFIIFASLGALWYYLVHRVCQTTVKDFRNRIAIGQNLLQLDMPVLSTYERFLSQKISLLVFPTSQRDNDSDKCYFQHFEIPIDQNTKFEQNTNQENLESILNCGALRFHFVLYPARGWFSIYFTDDGTITLIGDLGAGGD